MVKICFVCSNLWPYTYGGAERRYYEFAVELMRRGHEVAYVTYDWGPSEVPLATVGEPPRLYDSKGRRRIWPALTFGYKSARKLRSLDCDAVDITVPYTTALFMPSKSYVLTLHEYWGDMWLKYHGPVVGRLEKVLEKKIVENSKAVVTPTDMVANRIREAAEKASVHVIPFGLPLEKYRRYLENRNRDVDVVAIGRFVPYKGWEKLPTLLSKVQRRLKVVIVGEGPLVGEIQASLREVGHEVKLLSRVSEEEKLRVLSQSKYYINLSATEGFSIATLEAIACGTVPIVLRTGANAAVELVKKTGYGYAVASLDEAARVIAEEKLPEARPHLSMYDIRRSVDSYLALLDQIR
jgi:glycosyltransferase involved in cell wall biosynthesis